MIVARSAMLEMRSVEPYEILPEITTHDAPVSVNAVGTTPLFRVMYTPKGKDTPKMYGVFWHGENKGVLKMGLRALRKDGVTMFKAGHPYLGKGFFVDAAKCERVK